MKHIRSLFHSVIAFISAIAIILGVASPAGAEVKDISEWQPVKMGEQPDKFYKGDGSTAGGGRCWITHLG